MSDGFTISLARLRELPEVLASFKEHQSKTNSHQRLIIQALTQKAVQVVVDCINTVDIPLETGKVLLYVVEYSSRDAVTDALVVSKGLTRLDYNEGAQVSCELTDELLAGKLRVDFYDSISLTGHVFRLLYLTLKDVIAKTFPRGNVKVSLKREKTRQVQHGTDAATGEDLYRDVTTPRHLAITVSIPSSMLTGSTPRSSKKQTRSKRSQSSAKKAQASSTKRRG